MKNKISAFQVKITHTLVITMYVFNVNVGDALLGYIKKSQETLLRRVFV